MHVPHEPVKLRPMYVLPVKAKISITSIAHLALTPPPPPPPPSLPLPVGRVYRPELAL